MSGKAINKDYHEVVTKLGSKIKSLRLEKGMTQMDLAVIINIDASAIRRYEKGRVEMGVTTLLKFAEALEVSLDELVTIE